MAAAGGCGCVLVLYYLKKRKSGGSEGMKVMRKLQNTGTFKFLKITEKMKTKVTPHEKERNICMYMYLFTIFLKMLDYEFTSFQL
jgi:hypothetical protein